MKTQKLLEKHSAMGRKQKYCILAEEVTRILYNVAEDREEEDEVEILEQITRQLKNSGWSRQEVKEIIVSGYKGWKRRLERRIGECGERYRSAAISLPSRARSKLTGKVEWFKTDRKRKREEEPSSDKRRRTEKGKEITGEEGRIVSVMFVPYTPGGELARRLHEVDDRARESRERR